MFHPAPFILEEYTDPPKNNRRQKRIIFNKNVYSGSVKFYNWEVFREAIPYDNNPYLEGYQNYFKSHYNYLGSEKEINYSTTTKDMLNQIYLPKEEFPYQPLNSGKKILSQIVKEACGDECANRFITTMQQSYTCPFKCEMKRVKLPKTPFMEFRRRKNTTLTSVCKFYDDNFHSLYPDKHLKDNNPNKDMPSI